MNGASVFDSMVRILGKREFTVENASGICEINENCVIFRMKKGAIEVRGEGLVIVNGEEGTFSLMGEISSVSYL